MTDSGDRVPWLYGIVRDASAQSEPLGVLLLIAITVTGTTAIVALGGDALADTERAADIERAEHAMTLFDSQAATVALGDSPVRSISLGRTDGAFAVDPAAGRITVVHSNFDGGEYGDENVVNDGTSDDDEEIYSSTLGAITYRKDGTTVAYQGGGVWKRTDGGGSEMISPPEFHFRAATLTLPIIRVTGSGHVSGTADAKITRTEQAIPVYPDETRYYDDFDGDGTSEPFENPISDGKIIVTVQSDYYRGWEEYFKTRTTASSVEVVDDKTVRAELVSLGTMGPFVVPGEGNSVQLRGLAGGHQMDDFSVQLRPDDTDSSDFSNLQWSLWAADGDKQFEMHLRQNSGSGCEATFGLTVYYSDNGGETYHGWNGEDVLSAQCGDYNGDGDDEVRLDTTFVDDEDENGNVSHESDEGTLVPEDDIALEYSSLSSSDLTHFNPNGDLADESESDGYQITFDEHSDVGWEPKTYDTSAGTVTETTDKLLNHYLGLMGVEIDLTVDDKNSDSVSEQASEGYVYYTGSNRFVTFLHVTENEVAVELD